MALPTLPTPGLSTGWGTTLNTYLNALAASVTEPAGVIKMFAGSVVPNNTLLCNGQAVSRTGATANLFSVIGTQYGAGDGSTTFNVPNLQGRVAVGRDTGQPDFDVLGEAGGAKTHTLTVSEMPFHDHSASTDTQGSHQHTTTMGTAAAVAAGGGGVVIDDVYQNALSSVAGAHGHNVTVNGNGGGQAHNNMPPYVVLNYIITI